MNLHVINYNGIYNGFLKYAKGTALQIDHAKKPDIILTWQDVINPNWLKKQQAKGVKFVVLQHGIEGFDHYYKKHYKPVADYHLAWDDFDEWCALSRGAKDVTKVDFPLWDSPVVKVDDLPEKYYLYIPQHATWESDAAKAGLEDAKIRAKYYDLPLVVKCYMEPVKGDFITVTTEPYNADHLGKCLYLIKNATQIYVHGKQTARILAASREWVDNYLGNSMKIINKVKEICLNI